MDLFGQDKGQEKAADDSNQPALTIYNQNFFVAREHLPLDLTAGVNRAQYAGIAAHLEPDSVILRDPAGRACRCWNRTIATILSRRNCCSRSTKARRLISWCSPTQIIKGKIIRSGYVPSTYYAQNYQQPVHAAHHRSGRRAALRAARTAAVSRALAETPS